MRNGALLASAILAFSSSSAFASGPPPPPPISGYVPTNYPAISRVQDFVSWRLKNLSTALKASDWNSALSNVSARFQPTPIVGTSFGALNLNDISRNYRSPTRDTFRYYYGDDKYAETFIRHSIEGTGFATGYTDKARYELAIKGAQFQSTLMGAIGAAEQAIERCTVGDLSNTTGADNYLDVSWALFASEQGPIALGEKRCPQFDTCTTAGDAGQSKVNANVLASYKKLKALASEASPTKCRELSLEVKKARAQMFVPVIQGLLREAWESDPKHGASAADGWIEVVEGFAFMRAVLPAIDSCSASAAATIKSKMDSSVIAGAAYNGLTVTGFKEVKAAVESTYECLGITCADVKAMIDPVSKRFLWEPCDDNVVGGNGAPPSTCTQPTLAPVIVLSIACGVIVTLCLVREFQGRGAEVKDRV